MPSMSQQMTVTVFYNVLILPTNFEFKLLQLFAWYVNKLITVLPKQEITVKKATYW